MRNNLSRHVFLEIRDEFRGSDIWGFHLDPIEGAPDEFFVSKIFKKA